MKNKVVFMVLVFMLASFCSKANAAELTATLGNIVGTAEVIKVGETEPVPAKNGMVVSAGDTIKTGSESFITITFLSGTFIELASNSRLKIMKHELDEETFALNTRADLLSGHLSKAIMNSLPPDAVFQITLAEFLPLEAEAYHLPGEIIPGDSATPAGWETIEAKKGELTAVVSNVHGTVELVKVGEVQAVQVRDAMLLNVGDILHTGRDSHATVTFCSVPNTFIETAGNSEVKIVRHEINKETSNLDARVDVLSGHLSRAIVRDLPPDANFEVVLVDYIPLVAEPYEAPESFITYEIPPVGSGS
ncbi:MAG: hypothetical protein U9R52_03935 [Candidatus Omnitrophota bacterium]|nr:hypothetical protein [Candidatus Omnitrophota bacterium]